MVAKAKPLDIGEVVGRLTVTNMPLRRGKYLVVPVKCSCGTEKLVDQTALRKGKVNSCGCLNRDILKERAKHGRSSHPMYAVWNAMLQRCENKNNKGYANYGGRGIAVADEWKDFSNFLADMGEPEQGMMLDRIDNDKGYSKENCRWVTRLEQNNNTRKSVRVTYRGELLTINDLAAKAGMNRYTLSNRLYKYNMGVEEAVNTPVMESSESGGLAGKPVFRKEEPRSVEKLYK